MAATPAQPNEVPKPTRNRDLLVTLSMMTAAAVGIAGFGMLFSMWWQTGITDQREILRIASQEFVGGRPIVAGELAATAKFEQDDAEPKEREADAEPLTDAQLAELEEQAEWIRLRDFLIGAGKVARAAEEEEDRQRRKYYHDAIPYLQASRDAGFPAGRFAEGNRLLGTTLFKVGRFEEATEALRAAIARDPVLERVLLPTLARAQLDSIQPTTDQSLQTIENFLRDSTLKLSERREGELIRIRALLDLERWQDAQKAIDDASLAGFDDEFEDSQAEFRDQIRLLQGILKVSQAIKRFGILPDDEYDDRAAPIAYLNQTMTDLADLQREAAPKTSARARLWMARAYLVQGMPDDALNQLTAVRQQRPFGAEGAVGGLEEIELLASQGRGIEMLQTTRYVMRELGDPQGFDAGLLTFAEFRRRLREAIGRLRQQGKFEEAIDTARSLPPVFAKSDALMEEGLGYRDWAVSTIKDGTDISGEIARSASILARGRYRAAGDAFAEAAQLEFNTPQYLPTQWSAIKAYQDGRHFSQSIELLEPYLRYEERIRQPRGLVAYGRALLAVGDPERAIDALSDCIIEFPRDPLRYDARLLAALAQAEQGELDRARQLLTDNLQDGELTPESWAWRDSLLMLGEILYRRGYENHLAAEEAEGKEKLEILRSNQPILEEAIRRLDEAVNRYWPMSRAEDAAYLSARTHVMAADLPRVVAQSPDVSAKRTAQNRVKLELQTALDGFVALRNHLAQREEEHRLPTKEQSMLRNCYLAEADTLRSLARVDDLRRIDVRRLEDAATAYRAVSLRYMNEPPALEAILGQARCVKELGRQRESDLLVRQAMVILKRIPNEWNDRFEETTRFDRNGWQKLLTWMIDQLPATEGAQTNVGQTGNQQSS